jgi:hypothetical protein
MIVIRNITTTIINGRYTGRNTIHQLILAKLVNLAINNAIKIIDAVLRVIFFITFK